MLPLSASPIAISGSRYAHAADGSHQPHEVPHAMTEEEIKRTVQEYKDSAALAKRAGFDGIELHGANGCGPRKERGWAARHAEVC